MINTTFYCVWWAEEDATPESQLMGIFDTQKKADIYIKAIRVSCADVYCTTEQTNQYGECK
jgi:hypothetical protein